MLLTPSWTWKQYWSYRPNIPLGLIQLKITLLWSSGESKGREFWPSKRESFCLTYTYRDELIKEFASTLDKISSSDVKRLWRQPIDAWVKTISLGSIWDSGDQPRRTGKVNGLKGPMRGLFYWLRHLILYISLSIKTLHQPHYLFNCSLLREVIYITHYN